MNEGSSAGLITVNGNDQNITINAQSNSRVFEVDSGSQVSFNSLTVEGGYASDSVDNPDGFGGAIYSYGSVTVNNSILYGNSADEGGGAIYNDGTLNVNGTSLSLNSASIQGGAAIWNDGTATVNLSTLSGNSASYPSATGGGAIANDGSLAVNSSTISGNSANFGGGIDNFNGGMVTVTGSTVSGNLATYGGGIFNGNSGGSLTANDSIIAGNSFASTGASPDIDGPVADGSGYNLIGDGTGMSGITNASGGNQIGTSGNPINPLLAPLGNYGGPTQTMALLPGSPAIDSGSNSLNPLGIDQRYEPRTVNGTVDIGAVESQGFSLSIASGNNQSARIGSAFSPLVVSVTANDGNEPVNGGVITFTATPAGNGASANLAATTATIGAGQASVTPTANGTVGSYTVSAAAGSGSSAVFNLSNTPGPIDVSTYTDAALRSAISTAIAESASNNPVTIDFTDGPGTILLTGGVLDFNQGSGTGLITVNGTNQNITINAQGNSAIFQVDNNRHRSPSTALRLRAAPIPLLPLTPTASAVASSITAL